MLGVGGHYRLALRVGRRRAAAHDRELAVLRALLSAGDRCIEEMHAAAVRVFGQLARQAGGGGRVVDEDRVALHGDEGAMAAHGHLAHIVVAADAGEHDVGIGRGLGRRGGAGAAIFLHPALGLCGGAVEDGQIVPGALEMTRHRVPHDAQP